MNENMSALRISVYDYSAKPLKDQLRESEPKNALRSSWIPQTMGDQIWVLHEFASLQERKEWEESLPDGVARFLDRSLISEALKYGWDEEQP